MTTTTTTIQANGAQLHVEQTGSGYPLLLVHEFAADHRQWETQVRYFSRFYRVITYAARGYPPSEVPQNPALYGQEYAADDIRAVLDGLKIERAHVAGLSMGAFASLLFALRHRERVNALVLAGAGGGSELSELASYRAEQVASARRLSELGWEPEAEAFALSGNRKQLKAKDPRGWLEFVQHLKQHSALGSSLTRWHFQGERDPVYAWEADLRKLELPTFIAVGDEDSPCLNGSLWLKKVLPHASLWISPRTGHAINLEEPAAFNRELDQFLSAVDRRSLRA